MKIISYNDTECYQYEGGEVQLTELLARPGLTHWIDFSSSNTALLTEVADILNLHHLMVEDIRCGQHLPRTEDYGHYFYFSMKMLKPFKEHEIFDEEVHVVMGHNYVLTIQQESEPSTDVFDGVRLRLINDLGRIRKRKSDYLFYRINDALVNSFLNEVENLRDYIEAMENEIVQNSRPDIVKKILATKKSVNIIRKYMVPLKDEFQDLLDEPSPMIEEQTLTYLRDVYDKINFVLASLDTLREILADLLDLHASMLSQNMNAVMKTLTVVSTIFIPLTFIVGIYGMNLVIPEASIPWFYPALMIGMASMAVLMFIYMRFKKWV